MMDEYKTIETASTGYFKDKGSKFHSFLFPVRSEEDVKDILQSLKKEHHSARHHCYAWRIGTEEIATRANDDGEPSSTAGKPILGQLQSFELSNVLLVVVRYFGGTLLGTSGLINAYKSASIDAISNAEIVSKLIETEYELQFEYPLLNKVMQTLKQEGLDVQRTDFRENCKLWFKVRKNDAPKAEKIFGEIFGVDLKPKS